VDGNVVTNANPTRPFDLDINCFANNGSGTLGDARIELDGPGGRVATVNDAAARDIMISQPGQYTARCVSNADASCYNIDTFNLIQAAIRCHRDYRPDKTTHDFELYRISLPENTKTATLGCEGPVFEP
jgi:hypothetical protein